MRLGPQLRAAGFAAFPCWVRYDQTARRYDKGPAVPRGTSWKAAATWSPDDSRLDWSSDVVGVIIPQGVIVLDLDTYKGATRAAVGSFLGAALDWDAALIQRTIGGGEHYAFRCDWSADARQLNDLGDAHCDTRVGGKGFICTGEGYTPVGFGAYAMLEPTALPALPDAARTVLVPQRDERPPAPPSSTPADGTQVEEALRHIDPGCGRADWVRVGLALRHHYADNEAAGLDLFDRWSAGDLWPGGTPDNYLPEHIEHQWGSFKPEGDTTAATLFYRAIQGGWRPPASFDTSAAFGPGAAGGDAFDGLVERVRERGGDVKQTQALVDEIRAAGCNELQVALLAAELKTALRDSGIKDAQVGKRVDGLLAVRAPVLSHPGAVPDNGQVLDADTPIHPTAWAPMHTKGKEMKPKGTHRNFEIMLNAYGVRIQFDEVSKSLSLDGPSVPSKGVLHDEAVLSYLDSLANLNDYPVTAVRGMIMPVANNNVVNPVEQYVGAQQWDGHDHVGALWSQIQLEEGEDAEFCEVLFRKWLRGAYGIGTGHLDRWEFVIVLIDPAGGAGKTRFFSTLCPSSLQTDSIILDTSNKDSIKMAISYWLTELGELDGTFSRSESARIKAFLSLAEDELRLPYGRAYLKYPRRTAFFASVNETHFLIDPSDNRRFWGIRVKSTNHRHAVDMGQVWSQAAAEFHAGHAAHLSPQEEQTLRMRNDAFRTGSPIADALSTLNLVAGGVNDHRTVSEVLGLAGIGHPSKADINEGARWLRRNGHVETRRGGRRGFCITAEPLTAPAFKPTVIDGGTQ